MGMSWVEEFVAGAQMFCPGFAVKEKKDSWLMRFLGRVLFFVPEFGKRYTTTIGRTVWVPKMEGVSVQTLGHELRHAIDFHHYSTWAVAIWYLFPQVAALNAVVALLAIWFSNWWLLGLLFLLLLLPLPAPGRMLFERRGYLVTLLVLDWQYGRGAMMANLNSVLDQFTGRYYYWMWPFKESLRGWFMRKTMYLSECPHGDTYLVWLRAFAKSHVGV